ncbi:hypothetical protein PHYSODRAFT_303256 [Phytophthora sojae]|uniref:Uncharacterized protein n=1 Tax=Phytophthora sojae (strain P6497) TaxID=1094619 RepID=G4ZRR8_PHYSP|nr:hypothetical protein PHYSODRAFT_303256 [Phytophthora sojae]EGZ13877.1 hypothetical protein PHYSODRAFT_303256 [Phytophthora sojae]|eukprot:XP_009531306.1 hypothetical protein PHYSODRAFT_303256 [Phytophthora sojae]
MRIGVGEWIIAVQLDTQDAVPRVDHYELGYREIGDVARHQLGTVIPIRWWYERPRGSDIWYERTHRAVVNEFEAVLPPVDDTVVGNARAASVQYAWKEGDQTLVVQAGDGSVAEANTTNVQGGWALQAPGGRSHHMDMMASYAAWLAFGNFMLVDEEGALIFGNTLRYLKCRGYEDQHRRWIQNQQQRDVARQTVQDGEIGMIYNGKWSESLRRFYWRARSNVLHTNAVKNRFDSRWSASCATCGEVDTQDHRFGLIEPECEYVQELTAKLTTLHRSLISQEWVPDQEIFVPAIAHDIGTSCGLEQRGPWCGNEPSNFLWLTMIRADNGMWLNPQWLDWLGDPAAFSKDLRFLQLLESEAEPNRPRGSPRCMIPVGLIEAMISTFLALKNGGKVFSAAMKVRVGNPHWCIGS